MCLAINHANKYAARRLLTWYGHEHNRVRGMTNRELAAAILADVRRGIIPTQKVKEFGYHAADKPRFRPFGEYWVFASATLPLPGTLEQSGTELTKALEIIAALQVIIGRSEELKQDFSAAWMDAAGEAVDSENDWWLSDIGADLFEAGLIDVNPNS